MRDHPGYYAIIPANVRYDLNLPPNARLMYGEIAALSDKSGTCWATNTYFARLYNVSRQTVSQWISIMLGAGYLKEQYINGKRHLTLRENPIPLSGKPDTPLRENPTHNTTRGILQENIPSPAATAFDEWYAKYPKKVGKKLASKAWMTRMKECEDPEELGKTLTLALDGYRRHLSVEKTEMKYVMHPSTFLGPNERWRDYLKVQPTGPAVTTSPFVGRKCPKCGSENRHTGGQCLQCGEELQRGKG